MKEQIIKILDKYCVNGPYRQVQIANEIVKLFQCKNIIAKVKEANTLDKRSFEEAEADKAGINELIPDTSENANQYNGRPNPQDVNPYDGRAILRKRNK